MPASQLGPEFTTWLFRRFKASWVLQLLPVSLPPAAAWLVQEYGIPARVSGYLKHLDGASAALAITFLVNMGIACYFLLRPPVLRRLVELPQGGQARPGAKDAGQLVTATIRYLATGKVDHPVLEKMMRAGGWNPAPSLPPLARSLGYSEVKRWELAARAASVSQMTFHSVWLAVLVTWAFLYVIMFSRAVFSDSPWLSMVADALNLASTLLCVGLYVVLDRPTVPPPADVAPEPDDHEQSWPASIFVWCLVAGLVFFLDIADVCGLEAKLGLPAGLVRALASGSVGFLGAVAMATLIGRLDSKIIGLNQAVLFLLYGYCAIQVGYPVLEMKGADDAGWPLLVVKALVLSYAVGAKAVLCMVVVWLLGTGRLMLYLLRMRMVHFSLARNYTEAAAILVPLPASLDEGAPPAVAAAAGP